MWPLCHLCFFQPLPSQPLWSLWSLVLLLSPCDVTGVACDVSTGVAVVVVVVVDVVSPFVLPPGWW